MPQGGIDEGEEPRQAVLRELKEEAGTDKAEIIGEMDEWITYESAPASGRRRLSRQVSRPAPEMVRVALSGRGQRHQSLHP